MSRNYQEHPETLQAEDDEEEVGCWIGDNLPVSTIDDAMITVEARPIDERETV